MIYKHKKYLKLMFWSVIFSATSSCQVFDRSESRFIEESYNPEKNLKVIVFEKPGNATVNNSLHASIEDHDYELNNDVVGNIFTAEQVEGTKINDLIINWTNNHNLNIVYSNKLKVFKKENLFENAFGKVNVQFIELDFNQIPDSLELITGRSLTADFNGDQKIDFASLVKNKNNKETGVLVIHSKGRESFVFGAGKRINNMTDLRWIEVFQIIPKGEFISPTLVDEETGDILGQDESNTFQLIGNGIFMGVEESHGGGIIFWDGNEYNWFHQE